MGKEQSPQVNRRTTRSSSSTTPNSKATGEGSKIISNTKSLTVNDLVLSDESINLEELINSFPHRRMQILELIKLLGPLNSPMIPLFVYGGASTGKTSTVLEIFKHLNRPFIYSSCVTCYNPRILFESILNQLLLHRKNESNGYSSAKRCEKPSDFVNLLRDALSTLIDSLKGDLGKSNSKKSASQVNGKMIYLIFDNLEHVREWDKSSNMLPFLFNLYDILKMPEVGVIFISKTSLDTYHSDTGYVEPFPVYFPDYTEGDLRQIFLKNQSNPKLYSSFLDAVLGPFCRITRRVDDVTNAISPLYKKYCELLDDTGVIPNKDMKSELYRHINPYISQSLKETFHVPSQPTLEASASKDKTKRKGITKLGVSESFDKMDFHMSTCAKYLLISAFLASRNPATLDASLFDSTGGAGNQKRKRKSSGKSMEQKESKEQELLMKGPGTFPLERLLAIFQCITSVAEYSPDDEDPQIDGQGADGWDSGLMSDVLLQLSSLCSSNFITKGGSCPLEGAIRYRSAVSEDMALKVARSLKFPLSKYLYRT
ncbi:Origin of replication complex subunit 5 [Forsythia ovata]|uniref:Origin of replication complex subunit 5 n=1 Tax=Forsythia ovata TaxID=205694 RepID=A0ABD1PXP5_9LAMI